MWAQLSENMHLSFSRRTYHARVAFLYHVARGLLDFGVRYFTVTWFLKGGVESNVTLSWENKTKNCGGP